MAQAQSTLWGRVMHENWIKPSQHLFWYRLVTYSGQAIIWTKAGLLLTRSLGFSGFWLKKRSTVFYFWLENQTENIVCVSRHRCSQHIVPCLCGLKDVYIHIEWGGALLTSYRPTVGTERVIRIVWFESISMTMFGVTKGITCSHVRFFKPYSCSTGVAAAGLRQHLLNMNDAFKRHPIFCNGWRRTVY